jgi:hypothetical protein
VRDRIAHYEFVPAGVLNISARGFVLMGGGEEIGLDASPTLLRDVLTRRTGELFACISELLSRFVAEVATNEVNQLKATAGPMSSDVPQLGRTSNTANDSQVD